MKGGIFSRGVHSGMRIAVAMLGRTREPQESALVALEAAFRTGSAGQQLFHGYHRSLCPHSFETTRKHVNKIRDGWKPGAPFFTKNLAFEQVRESRHTN